jgi:hypothetical protein
MLQVLSYCTIPLGTLFLNYHFIFIFFFLFYRLFHTLRSTYRGVLNTLAWDRNVLVEWIIHFHLGPIKNYVSPEVFSSLT